MQSATSSKMRLFNLAPDVKAASMTVGGKAIASDVAYSLGSAPPPSGPSEVSAVLFEGAAV